MPEFLTEFIEDLYGKARKILENIEDESSNLLFKDIFEQFWVPYNLKNIPANLNVLGIDSSIGSCPIYNGGDFFVARALALGKDDRYKEVFCDFDYLERSRTENFLGRLMEWTEHLVALKAIEDGFKGTLLIDGSIFGRMSHVPIELDLVYNKGFMIEYFRTLMKLLDSCYKNGILIIGISKESRTSFFREFLIKELLKLEMSDALLANILVNTALDNKRMAVMEAKKTGSDKIVQLIQELVNRKPDGLLIMKNAKSSGYTTPLLLGASQRMRRMAKEINADVKKYILSRFPRLSDDQEFMNKAIPILNNWLEMPSVISFHILPNKVDTPMRIDVPAFYFGINERLLDVGWPEIVNVDLDEVLNIISAGYCGIQNYNIWLKAVDDEVKLRRIDFEELYLNKFEEIIGKRVTPRGYRRVRYP